MQDLSLSTIDLVIVAVYFLLVFAIGFRMARRTRSDEEEPSEEQERDF